MASSQPHKYFENQFDDEEVLYVFRRHAVVMRSSLIFGLACWLIGPAIVTALIYLKPSDPPSLVIFFGSMLASIIFGCIVMLPGWISWHFSIFIVTDQRFVQITQKGLFHTTFADIQLAHIQQVNYEVKGLEETLIGFGTIRMQTYMGELEIRDLPHPAKIQRKLVQILRDEEVKPIELPFKRGVPEQSV